MKLIKANMARIEADFAASGKSDQIVFDDSMKRFGLRLRASGRKTWIIQYEQFGCSRRVSLGDASVVNPDQARDLAKKLLANVDLGNDPGEERAEAKIQAKRKLKSVVEQYLQAREWELRPSTFAEVKRYLTVTFKRLHTMPIKAIQRADVASVLRDKANESLVAARQARSAASTFFGWAVGEGFIEHNPVSDTNRFKLRPARDRVLSDAELAQVWNACLHDDYGKIVRLLILTGARRDEIAAMEWSELDQDNRTWTLPAERSKNHRSLTLTLPPLAWDIIECTTHRAFNEHLFGSGKHGFTHWMPKAALDKRSGVSNWTIHDLRRTAATGMATLGVLPHVVEAVLNHTTNRSGVAGIYNRATYSREIKTALAMWADHIRSITDNTERKIIPISRINSGESEPAVGR
jgi:integrase